MIGWEEEVLRIVLGALLGGLVGLDREIRGQAPGCAPIPWSPWARRCSRWSRSTASRDSRSKPAKWSLSYDPSRVASQIVVGIGFLGAGAIMRHGTSIKGLTTAASLWVVAALGLSVGVGYYLGAITASRAAADHPAGPAAGWKTMLHRAGSGRTRPR